MVITISNIIHGIHMTLTDEQVSRLDDSRPLYDILSEEQKGAVMKAFPKTSQDDLIVRKAGEGFASILWTYRPLPSYCSHIV